MRSHIATLVTALLPQFSSKLTDIRKTVVFVLVEINAIVGQQILQPFLLDLTPAQSKLLMIYIARKADGGALGAAGHTAAVGIPAGEEGNNSTLLHV